MTGEANKAGRAPFRVYFGLLVVVVVVTAALSVAYVQIQSSSDAKSQARHAAEFAATGAAGNVGSEVKLLRASVAQLAANPSIVQAIGHSSGCSLTFGGGGHIDVLRIDGAALCSSRPRYKNGGLPGYVGVGWVKRAATGPLFVAPIADTVTNQQVMLDAQPVSGKVIVAGFADLGPLATTLASTYGAGTSPEFLIVDEKTSTVVARSINPKRWVGASVAGTAFARNSARTDRSDVDGVKRIYASATVPGVGWKLYVGENEARALASGTRLRNRELAIVLSSLAAFLLVMLFVYRRTVVPLRRLSVGVQRTAAEGHASQVDVSGPAEVRGLATEVNALIASVNAQEAVRQAKEAAERANEAKSRFLSHMSHEFRTPLAAIMGFAELLNRGTEDEQQRAWSNYVLDGGRHLLQLVNELLEISRIEAGQMMLAAEPVDVTQSVDDVLSLVRPLAAERGIRVERVVGDGEKPIAHADPLRLKQVLLNLVSNAIKYNREDGTVTVATTETEHGTVRIDVTDTGRGIPPEQLVRLFTPFERLGAEHTHIDGSGLGLVVTKGLVEAMDGRIDVESEVGEHTTFTIELPLAGDEAREHENVRPVGVATAGDVLYVDDSAANLDLVGGVLAKFRPGLVLRTASEGNAGAELAARRRPDLLLLDLNLPDIPGEEVMRRLRARPLTADVPVVILSADSTSRNITRLLQSGADAYVTKPIDVAQFLDVVDRMLAV